MDRSGRPRDRVARLFSMPLLVVCLVAPASAQQISPDLSKAGRRFRTAFAPVASEAGRSVVRVLCGGKPAALGVVVSADGLVLTKASQLHGEVTIRLPEAFSADGNREVSARTVSIHPATDLALLQVDAEGLEPIAWADGTPEVGAWLVSVGDRSVPAGVGVVSVAARRIAAHRGVLGIVLADDKAGPKIAQVFPNTGASAAGLQVDDVITRIEDDAVSTREALMGRLSRFRPGESLKLIVRRGEKEESVLATLGNEWSAMMDRQARQNLTAGPLSVRSGGFDLALQHDTVIRPEDCGGPVVDLDGRVVGLNIARAGRVESYALPAAAVRRTLETLTPKSVAAVR